MYVACELKVPAIRQSTLQLCNCAFSVALPFFIPIWAFFFSHFFMFFERENVNDCFTTESCCIILVSFHLEKVKFPRAEICMFLEQMYIIQTFMHT